MLSVALRFQNILLSKSSYKQTRRLVKNLRAKIWFASFVVKNFKIEMYTLQNRNWGSAFPEAEPGNVESPLSVISAKSPLTVISTKSPLSVISTNYNYLHCQPLDKTVGPAVLMLCIISRAAELQHMNPGPKTSKNPHPTSILLPEELIHRDEPNSGKT